MKHNSAAPDVCRGREDNEPHYLWCWGYLILSEYYSPNLLLWLGAWLQNSRFSVYQKLLDRRGSCDSSYISWTIWLLGCYQLHLHFSQQMVLVINAVVWPSSNWQSIVWFSKSTRSEAQFGSFGYFCRYRESDDTLRMLLAGFASMAKCMASVSTLLDLPDYAWSSRFLQPKQYFLKYSYLPNPPNGQDMTQGKFLSRV